MTGFFSPSEWEAQNVNNTNIAKCGACKLYKSCLSPRMEVTGRGRRKILFVAEAPGEQEDRQGIQLIGKSGQLLRKVLRNIKVDLDDCWKTNAVICRPPKNEITDLYIECCRPNLMNTIRELKPNVIVLLGVSAVRSLIPMEWGKDLGPLERWVGWTIPSKKYNAWLCPTYHPSFLLRLDENQTLMRIFRDHLLQAVSKEKRRPDFLDLEKERKKLHIITDRKDAIRKMRELSRKSGILAFDYETTGLKPEGDQHEIVSCSFCLNGEETFACMMGKKRLDILSTILKSKRLKKVASNMKFEEHWTRVKLGHPVIGWHWDTMLASHVLDNRPKITSVKFQAYTHLGVGDYDSSIKPFLSAPSPTKVNKIRKANVNDLLVYNAYDSLLEYKVMEKQKEVFNGQDDF